ncbi:single-stranded-DNA-specific exonuclease RecJ [Clostridium sp. JN-9]|uniref:single-stranded-DNA-specific exonuclease RecJ n=1 Tax=Clostridium sp. JN-9 TaxID=2507159 RepID=UPI000FFE0CDC|nr:single-stranded-DNA-specific exonuclease RecJ [Clostridium sp. JN-9]QAT41678.1 single-stranded-DNA-specific exonuclease RecJ [Clostridium sp. JN-9]
MYEKYNINPMLCKIIANRDIKDDEMIKSYLEPTFDKLHNADDMKDMTKVKAILKEKIKSGKKIRISSDFDVDGIISVFVLLTGLKKLGAHVDYEIPDRINDGYGINRRIIKEAYDDGVDTILTCDNGIAAIDEVDYANELGINIIITDHHDIPYIEDENGNKKTVMPKAYAILNPKQKDCHYKFKKLCGAGVAYKLIESLYEEFNIDKKYCYELMEFVAIATVCDVVDLTDENRVFVKNGLEMINKTTNIGLKSLIEASGLSGKKITAYHLGFVIGPCLNATGRLETAKMGLKLLMEKDLKTAQKMAVKIVELNNSRKAMTLEGTERAVSIIENSGIKNDKVLVVYLENIHESLAGIIAGRIKERYNKPTIVLTNAKDIVKGSARSIEGYNIFEELSKCKKLFLRFGGHPMAAGVTLLPENVDILRKQLNSNCCLTSDDLLKKIIIDMSLPIEKVDFNLIESLQILEPFGTGNNKPVFAIKNVRIRKAIILGQENNVLKLKLNLKNTPRTMDGIWFNGVETFEELIKTKYDEECLNGLYDGSSQAAVDLIFYPSINEWNGNKTIQIIINSMR